MAVWYFIVGDSELTQVSGTVVADKPALKLAFASADSSSVIDLVRADRISDHWITLTLPSAELVTAVLTAVVDAIFTKLPEVLAEAVDTLGGLSRVLFYVYDDAENSLDRFLPAGADPSLNLAVDPDEGPWRMLALEDGGFYGIDTMRAAPIGVTPGAMRAAVTRRLSEDFDEFAGELVEYPDLSSLEAALGAGEIDVMTIPALAAAPGFLPEGVIALVGPLVEAVDVPNVTGVLSGRDGALLDGVTLAFIPEDGGAARESLTDASGSFSLEMPAGTRGRVEAVLDYEPAGRDAGAITTADALAVLRIALGLDPAEGRQATEADLVAADFLGDMRRSW